MREILFRAKDCENKWRYGFYSPLIWYPSREQTPSIKESGGGDIQIKLGTLGQYTGVKDKNNKEVYDGDIIFLEEEHFYGKVCWENLSWYIYWYGWIDKEGLGTVYDIVNENPLSDELLTSEDKIWVAVVGNIYDNPEMLKGENLYDN